MRTVFDLDINQHPAPECFGIKSGAFLWDDATTPRTNRPVRFAARSLNHEKLSRTWRFKELGERGSAIIPPFPRA